MRTRDLWQMQSIETGRFLGTDVYSPGFEAGGRSKPLQFIHRLHDDRFKANMLSRSHWAADMAKRGTIDPRLFRLVPAPTCGCCGVGAMTFEELKLVEDYPDVALQSWRCEKHVGRLPCIVEGCGRTFAMAADDSYRTSIICGRHWREAPRYMRDAVARVRKIAKRKGWDEHLLNRHHRLWHRCIRAIEERRCAPAAIIDAEPIAGPPPAALLSEIARLGL